MKSIVYTQDKNRMVIPVERLEYFSIKNNNQVEGCITLNLFLKTEEKEVFDIREFFPIIPDKFINCINKYQVNIADIISNFLRNNEVKLDLDSIVNNFIE